MNYPIRQIPTDNAKVCAFEICDRVDDQSMEIMARSVNQAFDQHDSINLLVIFRSQDGADLRASFNAEVIKAQFRSLTNVDRYVVVGAPDDAERLINFMDQIIPIEAATFDASEEARAWAMVSANPLPAVSQSSSVATA